MPRYSPTARVQTTVPSVFELLSEVIDRGGDVVRSRRERELEDAEEARRQEAHDVNVATTEAALDERGYARGTAPQVELPPERDIFAGQRPGMAGEAADVERARGERRMPDIFQGERPGMAAGARAPASALDAALQRIGEGDVDLRGNEVVALPGSFVRGQGFVPRAVRRRDLVDATRERFARPREGAAPGFRQVTEDLYKRPQPRQPREAGTIEDRTKFTEEELRAAGVEEGLIPAAVQDPILARQLITQAQRGEGEGRAPSAADTRLERERMEERRDARISELILEDMDDRQLLAAIRREFPDTPTNLADVRRIRGRTEAEPEPDEVRRQERREALLELAGDPLSFGGGPAMEQLFRDLVDGVPPEQLKRELEQAYEAGMPENTHQRLSQYLELVSGLEILGR